MPCEELGNATRAVFSNQLRNLHHGSAIVVAGVRIEGHKQLSLPERSSRPAARVHREAGSGSDSTVYLGCTETGWEAKPRRHSGLMTRRYFTVGSNRGMTNLVDRGQRLTNLMPATSRSTPKAVKWLARHYNVVVTLWRQWSARIALTDNAERRARSPSVDEPAWIEDVQLKFMTFRQEFVRGGGGGVGLSCSTPAAGAIGRGVGWGLSGDHPEWHLRNCGVAEAARLLEEKRIHIPRALAVTMRFPLDEHNRVIQTPKIRQFLTHRPGAADADISFDNSCMPGTARHLAPAMRLLASAAIPVRPATETASARGKRCLHECAGGRRLRTNAICPRKLSRHAMLQAVADSDTGRIRMDVGTRWGSSTRAAASRSAAYRDELHRPFLMRIADERAARLIASVLGWCTPEMAEIKGKTK